MKKLTLAVIVALLLAGCASLPTETICGSDVTDVPHTFVVSAFDIELDAVSEKVDVKRACSLNGVDYHLAEVGGHEIVLYLSGVGPVKAEESTKSTLENFRVQALVFSGIAGGLNPELKVGETVIPGEWYELNSGNSVPVDAGLLEIAQPLRLAGVGFPDSGVTADAFVTDGTAVYAPHHSDVVDMETYAVAIIARERGVPFLAIRSVSDYANGVKNPSHYQTAAQASAQTAIQFLELYLADQNP